ncbi:MAG TPA: hypothetical protein VHP81_10720 [Lachnospiraceae bacterium]|nr:hypothetical protein [Lachnospiraceae bacterium]
MEQNLQQVKELISDAEYVLVGLGSRIEKNIENEEKIFKPLADLGVHNRSSLDNLLNDQEFSDHIYKILANYYRKTNSLPVYSDLFDLIKDKNYFIISMNTSEYIFNSELDSTKIVMPCGNEGLFQCSHTCTKEVWSNMDYVNSMIDDLPKMIHRFKTEGRKHAESLYPKCNHCESKAVFNVRSAVDTYVEEGYLPQWQIYMQWLSRTLNRKLVLIELDVDFDLPSLIRWPFEKNAYINNKASLIRVNSLYPQLSEEINGKGISLPLASKQFLDMVN